LSETYDKSKGGWQRINGTLQWVNTSPTPVIDSLQRTPKKPRDRGLSEILGSNI